LFDRLLCQNRDIEGSGSKLGPLSRSALEIPGRLPALTNGDPGYDTRSEYIFYSSIFYRGVPYNRTKPIAFNGR